MESSLSSSSSRKSNKIRDIVRLQQILKKWKKVANSNKNNSNSTTTSTLNSSSSSSTSSGTTTTTTTTTTNKSINKFLKKTLSFSESSSSSSSAAAVPKGYVAVCVGMELKRFVIPTEYLRHQMFGILLREAEEEFGFQQEGVLKFPCEVELFQKILKMMEDKRSLSSPSLLLLHDDEHINDGDDEKSGLMLLVQQGDYDRDHDHVIINCATNNNYSPPDTTDQLHPRPQMCR